MQGIFGFQIKAGRAILRMSQSELESLSGVSIPTIQRIEASEENALRANYSTIVKLQNALEKAGVKFLKPTGFDGNGAGVRLWKEVVEKD